MASQNTQYPILNTRPLSRFTLHASRLALFIVHHSSFIVLAALILLAVWPLLTSGLPTVGDGLNHFYRFAALDWHVRHGDLYPRWFANLHYGFGAPVFDFYAPLSYYIPLFFRLFDLPLSTSLQLGYALALATAVVGAYVWAAAFIPQLPAVADDTRSDATTGLLDYSTTRLHRGYNPLLRLLAAAAYGLSPYLYLNIFHRGAYPELWALAFAPWLLWSTWRLTCDPNRKTLVIFVFLNTALILTHTVSAFIFAPITLSYVITLAIAFRRKQGHDGQPPRFELWSLKFELGNLKFALGIWILGFGISLLLSAFFLLPVLFESRYIQLYRTTLPADLDYRRNFLTLAALFSPPPNFDPRLVFNAMPASLPWPQVALAFVALIFATRSGHAKRPLFIVHCSFFIALSFLTLSASAPLWSFFPLARFIQFPWRLVGPASLFLAALAAAVLSRFASTRLGIWVLGFGISFFFLFSLPWTYHANFEDLPSTVTASDSIRYEIDSGHLGTTSAGEYLPRWVSELPAPDTLLAAYADSDFPSRLASLPAQVTRHPYGSRVTITTEELTYTSSIPFTATFNLFYFPGWTAALDGNRTAIRVSSPNGLITVPLPAGQHTLRLALRATPPQMIGAFISLVTLLALLALALASRRKTQYPTHNTQNNSRRVLPVFIFILALLGARIFYFDRFESLFHHTSINSLPNPTAINFDDQLELIGFDHPQTLVSGGALDLTLFWRALAPLTTDYSTTVQLADRFGNRFGASDSQHPNGAPTSRWTLDQYARDSHHLVSLTGTPPGEYHLLVGAYARAPLSVLQEGAPAGVEYDLGQVTVSRALPQTPGVLRLVKFELANDAVAVGDQLAFTVLWNSGNEPLPALTARLLLTDSADQTIFSADLPPAGEDYPTVKWTANELIRFPFSVGLPPDLVGGVAKVSLLLVDASGETRAGGRDLATITVVVPSRSFSIPPMAHRVDYGFADSIRLLGYDLSAEGITLYWQALKPVSTRLTAFVHQLDSGGAFVAGHDNAPARPTTSWLAGEVIADVHPISVGDHFEVGLYDPVTGERFGEPFEAAP